MTKYIEREKLINELQCLPEQGELLYLGVYDCVNTTPTADVQEVKHGKWIDREAVLGYEVYQCSVCKEEYCFEIGSPQENGYNFCPNCGAKMDGGANDEM